LLVILTSFSITKKAGAEREKAKEEYTVPVYITPAKTGEIRETLKFNGTIYSMSSVNISSKTIGQVTKLFYDEGDRVKADEIILKIDDEKVALRLKQAKEGMVAATEIYNKAKSAIKLEEEQVDLQIKLATSNLEAAKALYEKAKTGARPEEKKQAEANMLSAESALKNAESNYNRMKELYEKKTISKQQYDLEKMQYDMAKAQYEIAKENFNLVQAGMREEDIKAAEANYLSSKTTLNIAESLKNDVAAAKANLKQAEYEYKIASIMLEDTLVRAPIDGVISKKFIEEGEIIQAPGIPLFKILNQNSMKVKVNIPETNISKISKGLEVLVGTDSYPNKPFMGTITKLSPTVDVKLRTLEVEVTVPNSDGLLREGMFARVSIYTAVHKDAVYVPASAVTEKNGEKTVFVVQNNSPIKRVVKTGIIQGEKVEVLSGIAAGENVIYKGNLRLEEGMKIRIESE
jgi:HlyD family secretion protein